MLERHLALAHPLGDAAVARVEALQARVAVVVPVGVVAVEQQIAALLDLVGRVVGEEPGRGGVAQAELEQRRRAPSAAAPRRARAPRRPSAARRAAARSAASRRRRRAAPARKQRRAAMPTSHSSPAARTSGASGPCGSTVAGPEVPGVRAQLGQGDRHEREQDADQHPGARAGASRSPRSCGRRHAVARRARRARALGRRASDSQPAATASTSQVIGSSRKPL